MNNSQLFVFTIHTAIRIYVHTNPNIIDHEFIINPAESAEMAETDRYDFCIFCHFCGTHIRDQNYMNNYMAIRV